ncbi:hypothetical protein CJ030_MR1G028903 [Morella rubra]|uniref:Uncharacterized protein n=1 Tax=Morella rubra TaxID=262757 RepID=A0A6A1V1Z1_9ROSI|nr:hypothetical protein CJ030_MR7G013544 [Morella rubra]KAB1227756.1 hypothetical protein CJ030_MR1G028903 [Morella rubra]
MDLNDSSINFIAPCTISNSYDLDGPVSLQLSQPQPHYDELPEREMRLGYLLDLLAIMSYTDPTIFVSILQQIATRVATPFDDRVWHPYHVNNLPTISSFQQ